MVDNTPMWVTGAINALMEGAKDSVVSSTKDAMQTSKKGDSPNSIAEPPKTSLQPMAEIVSATSGSGSYLQMAATTTEGIKAVLASHKETLSDTQEHLHDHKHEAPEDMLGEIDMMLKAMCDSLKGTKEQHDKPNGIQWISDSQMRINSPSIDMGGQNVSIAGNHGQLAFEAQSNVSKCQFDWHQIQMQDVKFVHHNYQVRNAVVGTDSKSGVSNRTYFNEVSTDAAHSISSTTKLHSIQASDIEEKADSITSRAIERQDVQAGEAYTLSVGQGTAKGSTPHFFMAGGIGAAVAQKALKIGLSKVGGGLLGNLVGNPTPGVVISHTPQGSNYVSPKVTEVIGSETINITGMARRVVHGEAINVANRLLADVSKGVKLEGVAGGVLSMITKKFSLSMTGWMGELINKVIGEVTDCIEFPELPKLPEITLPRVPQISCMPEAEDGTTSMKKPPTDSSEGDGHKEGVHSEKYPIWLDDALKGLSGLSGKVALNQEGISGTDGASTHAPTDQVSATFGAPLMVYKGRAPVLGMKKSGSSSSSNSGIPPLAKGAKSGTSSVSMEMKLDGVSNEAQDVLRSYAAGSLTKADALSMASSLGSNISPYMDRSNFPATLGDTLGVRGTAASSSVPSLSDVIEILTGGKSMTVGDVIESVVGQIPGVKGESISLEQALQDIGLGSAVPRSGPGTFDAVGKDGTLESAELLSIAMEKAGLYLPEGMIKMDGDTVSIDVDSALDATLDKAVSFLGDLDPIMKVDKLLKLVGLGTPLTNLLNDLAACAKSWVNIRSILKLPDIALDSVSGKIGKIQVPGLDLDFLKDWSLCGSKQKASPILWDGVQQGQKGYEGDGVGTA